MNKPDSSQTNATVPADTSATAADMSTNTRAPFKPEILAPAGDRQCLMAALAAGADAVYLGLKHFSARMQAENFSVKELARLAELMRKRDTRLYIALNTLVKPDEPAKAGRLIDRLERYVRPNALIVQDLGTLEVARQAGFTGELHLSTLANVTHPGALAEAHRLGASRVVLPRELDVDEIRAMADACPDGLDLETFVHGALCFCVSGRCYWSSHLGGKSGLRGRCVQPCRRTYIQKKRAARFFSCKDLSLDVLIKPLLSIERVRTWKIEGRKKGPHYVYYATTAYRMLRDAPDDPQIKKQAVEILEQALTRPTTHYHFLPQRQHSPTDPAEATGSGMLAGKIAGGARAPQGGGKGAGAMAAKGRGKGHDSRRGHDSPGGRNAPRGKAQKGAAGTAGKDIRDRQARSPKFRGPPPGFRPRFPLLPGDMLRVGYEDQPWHRTVRVTKPVPKAGLYTLPPAKGAAPKGGTPVFLVDRREPQLMERIRDIETEYEKTKGAKVEESNFQIIAPKPFVPTATPDHRRITHITVGRALPKGKTGKQRGQSGLWLSQATVRSVSRTLFSRIWWWLPPVIWPSEERVWENLVHNTTRDGAMRFVLGAPWQIAFFRDPRFHSRGMELIAGPFCNVANPLAVKVLADMGISSAFVSPELPREDLLALPGASPLPLGMVIAGDWPAGISRVAAEAVKVDEPLESPKGEVFRIRTYGQNSWIYPNWPLDLTEHQAELERAGYAFFATLEEPRPRRFPAPTRTSDFNWSNPLL